MDDQAEPDEMFVSPTEQDETAELALERYPSVPAYPQQPFPHIPSIDSSSSHTASSRRSRPMSADTTSSHSASLPIPLSSHKRTSQQNDALVRTTPSAPEETPDEEGPSVTIGDDIEVRSPLGVGMEKSKRSTDGPAEEVLLSHLSSTYHDASPFSYDAMRLPPQPTDGVKDTSSESTMSVEEEEEVEEPTGKTEPSILPPASRVVKYAIQDERQQHEKVFRGMDLPVLLELAKKYSHIAAFQHDRVAKALHRFTKARATNQLQHLPPLRSAPSTTLLQLPYAEAVEAMEQAWQDATHSMTIWRQAIHRVQRGWKQDGGLLHDPHTAETVYCLGLPAVELREMLEGSGVARLTALMDRVHHLATRLYTDEKDALAETAEKKERTNGEASLTPFSSSLSSSGRDATVEEEMKGTSSKDHGEGKKGVCGCPTKDIPEKGRPAPLPSSSSSSSTPFSPSSSSSSSESIILFFFGEE